MCIIKSIGDFMKDIININSLTFRYCDKFIFDRFSLNIKEGEWVTITGPNGSGKSTLIKILTGLLKSESDITICGLKLNTNNIYDIRKNIGVIFDNLDNSFISETIKDDLIFSLENLCYSKKTIDKRLKEVTEILNIKNLLSKSPNELSGGEKCMAALGCAIMHNPKILILDEALSMIDEKEKSKILKILKKLKDGGMTIINTVHDLSETYYSDRLVVLNNGEIVIDGNPLGVMEYDRILNKLGIKLPFEIELSLKLKLYGLIDKLYYDTEMLVNDLWQ